MSSSNDRVVIGLDYGTTYTGVAYCDSQGTVRDIQIVVDWPGQHAHNAVNEKVPSQVAYGQIDGSPYEWGAWGNIIPPNTPRQYWTKLKLDEKSKRPRELRMLLALLAGDIGAMNLDDNDGDDDGDGNDDGPPAYPGKEPVDIVADFLTGVKDHVWRHMGEELTKTLFESIQLDVVLTVPAVWSDKAKDLTFKAATKAGFVGSDKIVKMVTEPEAAAIYTLKTLKSGPGGDDIRIGDHFVLCDAGGGTVDLLSYKVQSVSPYFKVEEAAVGTGDKCGSTFINRDFRKWLREKLGPKTMELIPPEKLREGSRIIREFEAAKMSFSGDTMKAYLTIPREAKIDDDPSLGIEDGDMLITDKDLRELFDPWVNKTLQLIDDQAAAVYATGASVKYVFLVGGFGKSDYLYKKVQEYCTARGFEARRPPFPWSAVARGAVARGLEPASGGLVDVRRCRYHYGTPVSQPFNPTKHIAKDAYIDKLTGERLAKGQMRWLLSKGDALSASKPRRVAIECCRTFTPDEDRHFGAQIAYCMKDDAPSRFMDDDVIPLCTVKADLSDVPESKFMRARTRLGGEEYFVAEFKIELLVDNSRLKFFLVFDGEEYGSAVPNFDA
ncbi:hypothetical protein GP486_001847 [Trichoglossum hirsutum]|uniref:Actin-like ATPase domain-containing protein n=1 Tax=Trichoglossum hirsutum TaxID=265104 RepID=A0A9P8LG27_9PEZI|nr:hypothetical protein GP486_001847 [Trichoglossum hirsutum]